MTKMFTLILVACLASLATAQTLTNADVTKLVKVGMSDDTVISVIAKTPANFDLGPDALVALKDAKVSDRVITAMLEKNSPAAPRTAQEANREVPATPVGMIKIPEGTDISVVTDGIDRKKAKANDPVECQVSEDVRILGTLVFAQGAKADCKVLQSFQGGLRLGGAGSTTVVVEYATAVDGTKVRTNGTGIIGQGSEHEVKTTLKVVASPAKKVGGLLGKLKKDKDEPKEEPKGETALIRAKVAADKEITLKRDLTASAAK